MASIERINQLLRLDPATGSLYWRVFANSNAVEGAQAGNVNSYGYVRVQIDGRSIFAHRIVFALANGRWPSGPLDHRNGIRSDNRPENLREASRAENNRNTKTPSHNKSGIKGVSWRADRNKWWAQIVVDGEIKRLGYFTDKEAAAAAYQEAAEKYFGEFARAA